MILANVCFSPQKDKIPRDIFADGKSVCPKILVVDVIRIFPIFDHAAAVFVFHLLFDHIAVFPRVGHNITAFVFVLKYVIVAVVGAKTPWKFYCMSFVIQYV